VSLRCAIEADIKPVYQALMGHDGRLQKRYSVRHSNVSQWSVVKRVARWAPSLALVVAGLYSFNLAAFHSWLSWAPPNPDPQWHRTLSWIFALLGLTCLLLAGLVFRLFRVRRKT
jgi:hypothetical protein